VPDDDWKIANAIIRARPVSHRGPTVGYRISDNGHTLSYIPDHEPALGVDLRSVEPEWISGHAVAHGADVLLHDSQYTEDEYNQRVGWGHSSVVHVVTFAQVVEARQLVMFHHDPLHTDDMLEDLLERAKELWDMDGSIPVLAYEGLDLDLT
jgi:ribonuclease BN (tRNA processing enzyme)